MDLYKIIDEDLIFLNMDLESKKSVLEKLSKSISEKININEDLVFEKLYEREKLGPTALGNGVAIPHARLEELNKIILIIIILNKEVEFDANDGKGVDIIFSLLVPNCKSNEHIEVLANIAEMLNNNQTRQKIKKVSSKKDLLEIIKNFDEKQQK